MKRHILLTLLYTSVGTWLLSLIFPKFRADLVQTWQTIDQGGTLNIGWNFFNPSNAFPIILAICGLATGVLLWWHHRPN